VFLWSCGQKKELPEGILNKEQMTEILLDIYYAQAKVDNARLKRDSSEQLYLYYQDYLLEQSDLDSATFYKSITYYLDHPKEFDVINEIVLDTLNLRLQKLEAQQEKNRFKRNTSDK
jgi:hypothetical protein